jgi:hypothetical protein
MLNKLNTEARHCYCCFVLRQASDGLLIYPSCEQHEPGGWKRRGGRHVNLVCTLFVIFIFINEHRIKWELSVFHPLQRFFLSNSFT